MTDAAAFNSRKQIKGRMGWGRTQDLSRFGAMPPTTSLMQLSIQRSKNSQQFCELTHSSLLVLSMWSMKHPSVKIFILSQAQYAANLPQVATKKRVTSETPK